MSDGHIINDIGNALVHLRRALEAHGLPTPSAIVYDRPDEFSRVVSVLRRDASYDGNSLFATSSQVGGMEISGIPFRCDDGGGYRESDALRKRAEQAEAERDAERIRREAIHDRAIKAENKIVRLMRVLRTLEGQVRAVASTSQSALEEFEALRNEGGDDE